MSFAAESLRREFPLFAALGPPLHYLDNAATSQMHRSAFEAMHDHDLRARGNVLRGNHRLAEAATIAYENARRQVAAFVNAGSPDEIVFTSGTTAAINLVAGALARRLGAGDEIVVSRAEHHSNFLPWQALRERGVTLKILPLTTDARLDTSALATTVGTRCRLIALTHASNVTGAITGAEELAAVVAAARQVGARVLLDGAQYAQHGLVDVQAMGIDYYAFSGHKCYGPTGIGALWGRSDALAELPPWATGGGMVARVGPLTSTFADPPRRFEAGTPPIAQAVGLGAALDWMQRLPWNEIRRHESTLLTRLLEGLSAIPDLRILGPADGASRLPVVAFTVDGIHPHDLCQVLDQDGVAIRGGHHCAQPLLEFLGVDSAARASLAPYNDAADVDALLASLARACGVLR